MFCHNCGNPVAAGASACGRCGTLARTVRGPATPVSVSRKRPAVITILAILNIIGGVLSLVASVIVFLIYSKQETPQLDLVTAGFLGALLGLIGIISILVAFGLLQLKSWARMAQIVLSCIGLLGFPMGTIINGLILFYLFRPGMSALFSGRPPSAMTAQELAGIDALQRSGAGVAIAIIAILLLGVVVIGILSAIAIPNLLTSMQRSKQKRTTADIRSVATAWEARATDFNTYLAPGQETAEERDIDSAELNAMLSPTYIRTLPVLDGWGHPLRFKGSTRSYRIISGGKDGAFEENPREGATSIFDCDLVYSNGNFVSYPEGIIVQ